MYQDNLNFKSFKADHLYKNAGYLPLRTVYLFFPSSKDFIEDYKEIFISEENDYFLVKKVPPSAFIEESFLQNFLKKEFVIAVTNNFENEVDNFFAITESGKLIISLENNVADYLSLHKEKAPQKGIQTHTVFVIETNHQDFVPGNKYYNSVTTELKKIDHLKFDVLLKWKTEENVCCGSLREYFESHGYECAMCEPFHRHEVNFTTEVPKLNFSDMTPSLAENVLEWLGMDLCGIRKSGDIGVCLNKQFIFDEMEIIKGSHTAMFQGFYTFEDIQNLLKKTKNFFSKDPKMPFVALICSGYQHCYFDHKRFKPVAPTDQIIFILISPQCDYWVVTLNV